MVGVSRSTVTKPLQNLAEVCQRYSDENFRELLYRLQVDEIWGFVCAKAKNVSKEMRGEFGGGDVSTSARSAPRRWSRRGAGTPDARPSCC